MRVVRPVVTVLAVAAAVAAVFLTPRWVSDIDLAEMGVWFIAILGLNIVTGYTGQISLGHGAFMAAGGYATAILVADHGVRDLWTIPLAGLVGGLAGFVVGVPALRLTGLYLALVTFGLAVATPQLLKWDKIDGFTGGNGGIQLFNEDALLGKGFEDVEVLGHSLTFTRAVHYLTWAIAGALLLLAWLILRGAPGRAFRATRDSEIAAAASGVNLAAHKTAAFAISAFYAGVAGALYVIAAAFVSPDTFPVSLSLTLLVGAVVAGLGSLWGLVAGAAFITFADDLAENVSTAPGVPDTVYGLVLVVLVLLLPTGVAGGLRRLLSPLTSRL
ncbi:MAG TPA: branched-chain amino acid ABC transporter permease [Gaiellaceae bacterium]|jgi:branched-chain amino acid transport system permease protein|nr:branched-chain amino acid ABC transporter permease [Gaiellaceae bacterium]